MQGVSLLVGLALTLNAQGAARWERQIVTLVGQLGDKKFPRREAAHKILLREGARILPVVERLGPQADPEIRMRLDHLRTVLPRCRVAAVWENKVVQLIDTLGSGHIPSLSGRVSLLALPGGPAPLADGTLRIRLHDQTAPGAKAGPVLLEEWHFERGHLRGYLKHLGKRDEKGFHFPLVLPWATYLRGVRSLSLSVHYTPPQGPPVECRSDVMTLTYVQKPAPQR